jgi:hypothetical protein
MTRDADSRRGIPAPWMPDGDGPALCRRFCGRLGLAGSGDPIRGRPVSWDGLALCRRFCRGFAARRPVIVARRPGCQVTRRIPGRARTEPMQ